MRPREPLPDYSPQNAGRAEERGWIGRRGAYQENQASPRELAQQAARDGSIKPGVEDPEVLKNESLINRLLTNLEEQNQEYVDASEEDRPAIRERIETIRKQLNDRLPYLTGELRTTVETKLYASDTSERIAEGLTGGLYIDSETNKADHIEEQLLHYSDLDAIFRHTGMTGETLTGDDVKKIHEILLEKGLTPDMLLAIRKFDIDPASFSNDLKYRAKFVAWYEGISSFIRGVAREYVASLE